MWDKDVDGSNEIALDSLCCTINMPAGTDHNYIMSKDDYAALDGKVANKRKIPITFSAPWFMTPTHLRTGAALAWSTGMVSVPRTLLPCLFPLLCLFVCLFHLL